MWANGRAGRPTRARWPIGMPGARGGWQVACTGVHERPGRAARSDGLVGQASGCAAKMRGQRADHGLGKPGTGRLGRLAGAVISGWRRRERTLGLTGRGEMGSRGGDGERERERLGLRGQTGPGNGVKTASRRRW
ncbi:hypothetical protein NL676_026058 [Syzygium grande]|nr:hypothetical protein NL676_026058 [Syzygium grande]